MAAFKDASANPSWISLFSFTNLFAITGNAFFVVFWLFTRRKRFALFSIIALLVASPIVKSSFGWNILGKGLSKDEDLTLKIMTWNVHLFDLGEWTRSKQSKNKIIDFIKEQDPDILCLQEYYFDKSNPNEPYVDILRQLGYGYHEFSRETLLRKRVINIEAKEHEVIEIGHAVFSKFPLSNLNRYPLDTVRDYYHLLGVDVALKPDLSLRLFTTHLFSVSLKEDEVDLAETKTKKLPTEVDAETKNILSKIVYASSGRAAQANAIDSIIKRQDLPVVICGDFNDMPGAYAYQTIKGDLADAFVSRGFGLGRTYRKIFPTLRIDYIFYDKKVLNNKAYSTPNINLSDHNPVIATFSIKNEPKQAEK